MPEDLTWPQVFYALIITCPSIIAAWAAMRGSKASRANAVQLATSNGKTVGDMVTDVHGEASLDKITFSQKNPEL